MPADEFVQADNLETEIPETLDEQVDGVSDEPHETEQTPVDPQQAAWDKMTPQEAAERAYAYGRQERERELQQYYAQMQQAAQQRQSAPPTSQEDEYAQAAKAIADQMSMEIVRNPKGDGGQNMIAGLLKGLTRIIEEKVVPEAIGRSQATVRAHQEKERFFQSEPHRAHFRAALEQIATSQEQAEAIDNMLIKPLLQLASEKHKKAEELSQARRRQGYGENAWGRKPLDVATIKDADIKSLATKIFA